jgi:acyl transferase domain-containing protein
VGLRVPVIECHGTGTALGDPIEVVSIGRVLEEGPVAVTHLSAVKSNLGHLEAAAGMAGLIKSILVLGGEIVPPNIHLRNQNPQLDGASFPFIMATEGNVRSDSAEAVTGVSSFGFGGTNAHAVCSLVPEGYAKSIASHGERTFKHMPLGANVKRIEPRATRNNMTMLADPCYWSMGACAHTGDVNVRRE